MKVDRERLVETLCIEEERAVGRDNTISWNGRRLQIPESPLRRHYVGARVKVHAYPDDTLGVLYGPRVIARFPPRASRSSGIPEKARLRRHRVWHRARSRQGAAWRRQRARRTQSHGRP